jgi:OOP family OmpA-OmpF porin
MTQLRGFARLVAAIGLIVLTGCTHGNIFTSENNTAEASRLAAQPGTTFNQNLAYEYAAFARNQQAEADYTSADLFAKKSMATARGGTVAPEEIARWRIPSGEQGAFTNERGRLVAMLATDAPQRVPSAAARAQARYDCWVEETDEAEHDDAEKCHSEYLAAMNETQPAPPAAAAAAAPAAQQFQVYFDFDRATLTAEARQIVEHAAAAAKRQGGSVQIELVGHADTVGTDAYNQHLSERRAKAVGDELVRQGIARNAITERGVGFREPPVPTPPGVREARNRVVVVTFH